MDLDPKAAGRFVYIDTDPMNHSLIAELVAAFTLADEHGIPDDVIFADIEGDEEDRLDGWR
uniref:Uncharacterized protein n=1 Tax=uncultured prokaryote TaxID=198431 RepID=A0A0H5Q329_9ZZZZ|nr:hypothetical protein [uncultured prokaryote]